MQKYSGFEPCFVVSKGTACRKCITDGVIECNRIGFIEATVHPTGTAVNISCIRCKYVFMRAIKDRGKKARQRGKNQTPELRQMLPK
jgi:hypothetical protein